MTKTFKDIFLENLAVFAFAVAVALVAPFALLYSAASWVRDRAARRLSR